MAKVQMKILYKFSSPTHLPTKEDVNKQKIYPPPQISLGATQKTVLEWRVFHFHW